MAFRPPDATFTGETPWNDYISCLEQQTRVRLSTPPERRRAFAHAPDSPVRAVNNAQVMPSVRPFPFSSASAKRRDAPRSRAVGVGNFCASEMPPLLHGARIFSGRLSRTIESEISRVSLFICFHCARRFRGGVDLVVVPVNALFGTRCRRCVAILEPWTSRAGAERAAKRSQGGGGGKPDKLAGSACTVSKDYSLDRGGTD